MTSPVPTPVFNILCMMDPASIARMVSHMIGTTLTEKGGIEPLIERAHRAAVNSDTTLLAASMETIATIIGESHKVGALAPDDMVEAYSKLEALEEHGIDEPAEAAAENAVKLVAVTSTDLGAAIASCVKRYTDVADARKPLPFYTPGAPAAPV